MPIGRAEVLEAHAMTRTEDILSVLSDRWTPTVYIAASVPADRITWRSHVATVWRTLRRAEAEGKAESMVDGKDRLWRLKA